jgi:hypothetical protein
MNGRRKPIVIALSLLFLFAIATVGFVFWSLHVRGMKALADGEKVVAVVNSTKIHRSDLSVLSPPVPLDQARALMVDFTLLDQAAAKNHITVNDSEMENERRFVAGNITPNAYAAVSKKLGRSTSGLDLQLKHIIILQKLAILRLGGNPTGMFHARGIMIKYGGPHGKTDSAALSYAKSLQVKVAHGADIAVLAKAYSDDNLSSPHNGDLGIISQTGEPSFAHEALDFNMQMALSKQLGEAKSGLLLDGPVKGEMGYWVLQIVSTQDDPHGDSDLYQHVITSWKGDWVMRYEPVVMSSLRSNAFIQPPLADEQQIKRG